MQSDFKEKNTLEKRKQESARIREKYPDRIPIIVEHATKDRTGIANIDKNKYLVPSDLTVGQFVFVVRKRIQLQQSHALFLFVNGKLPPASALMSQMYAENKAEDGFLYLSYAGEDQFGAR